VVSFRLAVVLIIRIHLKNRSTGLAFHSHCPFLVSLCLGPISQLLHGVLSARKLSWMATSFTPSTRLMPSFSSYLRFRPRFSPFVWKSSHSLIPSFCSGSRFTFPAESKESLSVSAGAKVSFDPCVGFPQELERCITLYHQWICWFGNSFTCFVTFTTFN